MSSEPQPQLPRVDRPRVLNSITTLLNTEQGHLYITVSKDADGRPFEVFGALGKAGGLEHGMTELACRLISLHLRRGTPLKEIIEQCQGIQEMQAWPNPHLGVGVMVKGLGDGIAHILSRLDQIEASVELRNEEEDTHGKGTEDQETTPPGA